MSTKQVVVIAGEASADSHAALFIEKIKKMDPSIEFSGIGGQHMQALGVKLIYDVNQLSVTGLTEIIKHLWFFKKVFTQLKNYLDKIKPDLLILIDYPGFNLQLAKYAKKKGIKILYYISPQIWAWKANRIKIIAKTVTMMAVIFPLKR